MVLMKRNAWQRLHQIVTDRIDQLGLTRDGIHARGGPSSEWIRGLQNRTGKVTVRQTRSLLDLDAVMGWNSGTSRSLINDDRSAWSKEMLESEEHDLVYTNLPAPVIAPEQNGILSKSERDIRNVQTMVAAALRAMPAAERRRAIAEMLKLLGIS